MGEVATALDETLSAVKIMRYESVSRSPGLSKKRTD